MPIPPPPSALRPALAPLASDTAVIVLVAWQLCINYTNEKLQQLFIQIVFKEQQAEYAQQGIAWQSVAHEDNAETLGLLEGAQGVLALLEEQCLLGERGSDGGFCRSISIRAESHSRFLAPRLPRAPGEFIIRHYAGEVSYWGSGFLERNLDTLSSELGQLLASSAEPLLRALFREQRRSAADGHGAGGRQRGVGVQAQLAALMARIRNTRCRVPCVNPNGSADAPAVASRRRQLRCSGVMHAVNLARAAYRTLRAPPSGAASASSPTRTPAARAASKELPAAVTALLEAVVGASTALATSAAARTGGGAPAQAAVGRTRSPQGRDTARPAAPRAAALPPRRTAAGSRPRTPGA